jgi:parallel beta-helix repeat protein
MPGAVIKFAPGTQLIVLGTINANGSGGSIYFTSRDDDSYGEHISGSDGIPAPGDWYGIYFYWGYPAVGKFDSCIIRYGGNSNGAAQANIQFNASGASSYFNNSISEYSAIDGISIGSSTPAITNSTISNNTRYGLYATGEGNFKVTGNTFTNNGSYGVYATAQNYSSSISGNTGSGNGINGFGISGSVSGVPTWSSGSKTFPFVLIGTTNINYNAILTIPAGTIIKAAANGQMTVQGTLDVYGTVSDPVVFTSLKDDTYGGNTDGVSATPAPGDWYGIYFYWGYPAVGKFDSCIIRYGGNSNGAAQANIQFNASGASSYFNNSISEYSAIDGIFINSSTPAITNSTISNNTRYGIYISSSSPNIVNSIIWGNTNGGVYVLGGSPVILYSDIQGGYAGEGNINTDPVFVNPANHDYHLKPCLSPCIDAGDPVELLSADYIVGGHVVQVVAVTNVYAGDTIWITNGILVESDVVANTTSNSITLVNGFANSYTAGSGAYLCTAFSDFSQEPAPNGSRINMGAYGGTSEAEACRPPCECDLNHDTRCDMRDWLLFGQRWGATNCNTVPCACDLNNDGRCDMRDWLLFGKGWGRTNCPIQ